MHAGNRNPRNMKALLSTVLDTAVVAATGGQQVPFSRVLEWAGLTPDGLDKLCQRLLIVLASEFGGEAGERPLVNRLREPGGLRYAEQTLQEKGLITLGKTGRSLTKDGWERARELALAGVEATCPESTATPGTQCGSQSESNSGYTQYPAFNVKLP